MFPDTLNAEIKVTAFAANFASDSNTFYAGKNMLDRARMIHLSFGTSLKRRKSYRVIYADFSVKDNAVPPKVAAAVRIAPERPFAEVTRGPIPLFFA